MNLYIHIRTYVYVYIYIHIHSLYDVWPMGAWPFLVFSPFGLDVFSAGGHFNPAISCANALSTGKVGSLTASSEHGPKGSKRLVAVEFEDYFGIVWDFEYYLGIILNYPVICCIQGMKYYPLTLEFLFFAMKIRIPEWTNPHLMS